MNIHIKQNSQLLTTNSQLKITGSKSETNRLLLLQALYPNIILENTSNSDDSEVLAHVINYFNQSNGQIPTLGVSWLTFDVYHAGTAMRFLTAYFAIQEGREIILTGSSRMKERPIKILVEALQQLGAAITYEENVGFPPLHIKGKRLTNYKVSINANISSQFISALLLIAPKLQNGLELTLQGEITSVPYIKMTLALLNEIGVETSFEKNKIKVCHAELVSASKIVVESDWSSASYWYSIVALSEVGTKIKLSSFKENSLQGDSALVEIYKSFGVETIFSDNQSITIKKVNTHYLLPITFNLNNSPDIAQTIAVTCFGLGLGCHLTGLHTLKIKETDRLEALKTELSKFGATISVTNDSLQLLEHTFFDGEYFPPPKVGVATYQDHRMAMSFAPLAIKLPIIIQNAAVVSKSYPTFWDDLKSVGFQISE